MAAACLIDATRSTTCRDTQAATHLKLISILIIFFTSIIGISFPVLLARYFQGKPVYDRATLIIKCFAAGVILSTSLVHVLPDAFGALSDCHVASKHPWKDFPFAGLITLIGVLLALLVDLTASAHVEQHGQGHGDGDGDGDGDGEYTVVGTQEEMVGKKVSDMSVKVEIMGEVDLVKVKQRLVSQVLEIGIIFHSVIIGVTMGMSQNKCTIRPLVAALAFHQIFEGMGLGGCIAQVNSS
jgi:zinc transporter 1/2/3